MIWRFDFSRRALAWLLGISFVAGTGLELREQWLGRSAAGESRIVSLGIDPALAKIADSLHQVKVEELSRPININTATAEMLDRLPGIGPVLASRIIDEREEHGPFATVDELERVPGIGPKKLAAMRDRIIVE
ncbi:MAG: helix-hairpin-helix domain-containing protein [Calditrichaeota bacterium]|nr:helix-hairpin-helix domain-containing protein [Calditrichota bacterium]MCB9367739.1 helix-hairpin-helix domain-containing protein [Calditrichota bacterium]